MKLVSYTRNGAPGIGAVVDDAGVVELNGVAGASTMVELLETAALDEARRFVSDAVPAFSLDECRLLPPVPRPSKVLCVGVNYRDHAAEAGRAVAEHPVIFQRYAETLVPDGAPLLRSAVSDTLDYEGELAVVIGTGGSHIGEAEAMAHVAGYACFNDATVREWQFHTHQYGMGKNFRSSGGFGPWLVTADEIVDHRTLRLRTFVNGEVVQDESVGKLVFDIPSLISYTSHALPWYPGDVLSTGTPAGVGFARVPPRFLQAGDHVDVTIDGIGTLSNDVEDEPDQ